MFELSPLFGSLHISSLWLSSGVHVQNGLRDSGTFINIIFIVSSPPPGDPSPGTESNFPVSHPTPGSQQIDCSGRMTSAPLH